MLEKLVEGLFTDPAGSEGDATVVVECRRCGTSLEESVESCPYCGTTEVVRFEF